MIEFKESFHRKMKNIYVFLNQHDFRESTFQTCFSRRRLHDSVLFGYHGTGCSPSGMSRDSWWPYGWNVGAWTVNLRRMFSSTSS